MNSTPVTIINTTADNPFSECTDEVPYSGESTPVTEQETAYGGAVRDFDPSEGDILAVWVAGHWLIGTVKTVSLTDAGEGFTYQTGRLSISLTLPSSHRDEHDDLPTRFVDLNTKIDSDYNVGPDGWKSIDASVRKPGDTHSRRKLLGACGTIVELSNHPDIE